MDRRRRARAELKEPALAALRWIDEWGDRDGDGFVEFKRRSPSGLAPVLEGLGRLAALPRRPDRDAPIAPCEVQGYVYDAKLRIAEIAREVWRDRALAERLEREAAELKTRFDEAFWVEERGGFYALALDRDKQRVDSLTSNIGHLLWSGSSRRRVDAIVDRLMSEPLWSGWGVRTMSRRRGLQPAQLPQRHRLAPRQLPDRLGPRPARPLDGVSSHRPPPAGRRRPLRLAAAGGLRGARAIRDAVPDGGAPADVALGSSSSSFLCLLSLLLVLLGFCCFCSLLPPGARASVVVFLLLGAASVLLLQLLLGT